MAEACTITESKPRDSANNPDTKSKFLDVVFDWEASAGGAVSTSNIGRTTIYYSGWWVLSAETDPDGSTPPTAYTFTILNDQGTDVMCGAGSSARSATLNEILQPTPNSVPGPVNIVKTRLELQVASAGSGGKGRLILHLRKG